MRSRVANGEIFLDSLAESAFWAGCDIVESLCVNIGQTRWISRMRENFVYFLPSGIIQNLFTFSLDNGPKQVLINLILLLLSIYSVYKLNCTVVSGKHIGRRVAQRCCCGGIHVHAHCTVYCAWDMQDFICLICYTFCATALAYTCMTFICFGSIFINAFSCYRHCVVHSRKAAAVLLFNNSIRQSPYKGKQSRSTPQQNKKATSKWKTTV